MNDDAMVSLKRRSLVFWSIIKKWYNRDLHNIIQFRVGDTADFVVPYVTMEKPE